MSLLLTVLWMTAAIIIALSLCFIALIAWIAYVQERTRQDCPWGKHWGNWS